MVLAAAGADPQLDALVAAIVERIQPELVLLFGSRARGDAHADSDYDLMLVVRDGEDAEGSRKTATEISSRLKLSVDILARTTSEYLRRQNDPGFLDWLISREGRLLHDSGKVAQRSPRSDRVREQPADGVNHWIARAEDDYRAARNNINLEDAPWAAICFLSHASVEKLLKAIVVRHGTRPPRTHKLATLLELVPGELREDPLLISACGVLHGVYRKSRYEPEPMPTPEEGRSAFDAARVARDRLLNELKR
jgi:HEPN domain-containing protein/predicted nucleotidyltransferase